MSYGPYYDRAGVRYVYGSDGRWWQVLYSANGDDYGVPVAGSPTHPSHKHHAARPVHKPVSAFHTKPPTSDPWQGNNYARELFQGQGARYFIGANHLVVRATEVAAIAYTAAFLAPEMLATGRLAVGVWQQGLLGDSFLRYFWSGGFAVAGLKAAALAEETGGTTLEMTPLGQWLSEMTPNTIWLWKAASWAYATTAEGPVFSVQGDTIAMKSVWATIEYGILAGKNQIQIISATGRW